MKVIWERNFARFEINWIFGTISYISTAPCLPRLVLTTLLTPHHSPLSPVISPSVHPTVHPSAITQSSLRTPSALTLSISIFRPSRNCSTRSFDFCADKLIDSWRKNLHAVWPGSWWRHGMETLSVLPVLHEGNHRWIPITEGQ